MGTLQFELGPIETEKSVLTMPQQTGNCTVRSILEFLRFELIAQGLSINDASRIIESHWQFAAMHDTKTMLDALDQAEREALGFSNPHSEPPQAQADDATPNQSGENIQLAIDMLTNPEILSSISGGAQPKLDSDEMTAFYKSIMEGARKKLESYSGGAVEQKYKGNK